MRGAVILAGGTGYRFKKAGWTSDKALFMVEGKQMIVLVGEVVRKVVDEVVVTVDSEAKVELYGSLLEWASIIVDEAGPKSPMTGVRTGLRKLKSESCIVVPCDLPFLKPKVINKMLEKVENGFEGVVPLWPDGKHEPLTSAYSRRKALELSDLLNKMDRCRMDDLLRAGLHTLFLSIPLELKPLDLEFRSFINVNHPSDAYAPPLRVDVEIENIALKPKLPLDAFLKTLSIALERTDLKSIDLTENIFWSALARARRAEREGEVEMMVEASRMFREEATTYWRMGLKLLYARALIDASRCLRGLREVEAKNILDEALKLYRQLEIPPRGHEQSEADRTGIDRG